MAKWGAIKTALDSIAAVEAYEDDPYNSINSLPHLNIDLTKMSIVQARALQTSLKAKYGKKTSATIGRYQFTPRTLAVAMRAAGLNPQSKFSKANQDAMAIAMMDKRAEQATVKGKVDTARFAKALSQEWAGLASSTGKSYYAGVQGNVAGNTYADTLSIADGLVSTEAVGPNSGTLSGKSVTSPSAGVGASAPATGKAKSKSSADDNDPYPGYPTEPEYVSVVDATNNFEDTYLDTGPASPPESTATPPGKPSLGQQVAATAIDIGLSSIPGVGIAAGIGNTVASLAGRNTIGETLAGGLFSGGNGVARSGYDGGREGGDREAINSIYRKDAPSTAAKRAEIIFVEKYLKPARRRPTPAEKWDRNRDRYGSINYG